MDFAASHRENGAGKRSRRVSPLQDVFSGSTHTIFSRQRSLNPRIGNGKSRLSDDFGSIFDSESNSSRINSRFRKVPTGNWPWYAICGEVRRTIVARCVQLAILWLLFCGEMEDPRADWQEIVHLAVDRRFKSVSENENECALTGKFFSSVFQTRDTDIMNLPVPPLIVLAVISGFLPACNKQRQEHGESHKIVATTPQSKTLTITQKYVCQIHSNRHIRVRALERGYLEEIAIREGQVVKQGDVLFKVIPVTYQAKLEAESAEQELAQLEYDFTESLSENNVVSSNEVRLKKAKLSRAKANVNLARAELNFTTVKAPFDGIVDRLLHQQGSLVNQGDTLTTLSDNCLMWVYFNVPEASYLEYMTELSQHEKDLKIELRLANGKTFSQIGKIGAIEADFNNQTGNIPFRADFPNPDRLLRHGQTGTVLISKEVKDAIVIPQRATFQVLDKRYVFVIDKDNVAHQRKIEIENESDDIFIIKSGLGVDDKFILEGSREVRDGEKVNYEDRKPEQVIASLKCHAE